MFILVTQRLYSGVRSHSARVSVACWFERSMWLIHTGYIARVRHTHIYISRQSLTVSLLWFGCVITVRSASRLYAYCIVIHCFVAVWNDILQYRKCIRSVGKSCLFLTYLLILLNWEQSTSVSRKLSSLLFTYLLTHINKNSFYLLTYQSTLVIYPIAIAYSMGQIIKSVCVCQSVCVSVCRHSHGRISLSIFTKFDTEV